MNLQSSGSEGTVPSWRRTSVHPRTVWTHIHTVHTCGQTRKGHVLWKSIHLKSNSTAAVELVLRCKSVFSPGATVSRTTNRVLAGQRWTRMGWTEHISILQDKRWRWLSKQKSSLSTLENIKVFSMTHHTSAVLTQVPSRDPSTIRVVVPVHPTPWHTNAHRVGSLIPSGCCIKASGLPWQTGQQLLGGGAAGFEHGVLQGSLSQRARPSCGGQKTGPVQMKRTKKFHSRPTTHEHTSQGFSAGLHLVPCS